MCMFTRGLSIAYMYFTYAHIPNSLPFLSVQFNTNPHLRTKHQPTRSPSTPSSIYSTSHTSFLLRSSTSSSVRPFNFRIQFNLGILFQYLETLFDAKRAKEKKIAAGVAPVPIPEAHARVLSLLHEQVGG